MGEVISKTRASGFIRFSNARKHKTTRPAASWFQMFLAFGNPMKPSHSFYLFIYLFIEILCRSPCKPPPPPPPPWENVGISGAYEAGTWSKICHTRMFFILLPCKAKDCPYPRCQENGNSGDGNTWFPGCPPLNHFPIPIADPKRPWEVGGGPCE